MKSIQRRPVVILPTALEKMEEKHKNLFSPKVSRKNVRISLCPPPVCITAKSIKKPIVFF